MHKRRPSICASPDLPAQLPRLVKHTSAALRIGRLYLADLSRSTWRITTPCKSHPLGLCFPPSLTTLHQSLRQVPTKGLSPPSVCVLKRRSACRHPHIPHDPSIQNTSPFQERVTPNFFLGGNDLRSKAPRFRLLPLLNATTHHGHAAGARNHLVYPVQVLSRKPHPHPAGCEQGVIG